MASREENAPVAIANFYDRMQAEVALSMLMANGIQGHIDQPFLSSLTRLPTSQGIRLFVLASDAEQATLLLASSLDDE